MQLRRNLILAALALTLTACNGDPGPSPDPTEPTPTSSATQTTEGPSPRPSSTFEIPSDEPAQVPSAQELLATGGPVSPYEFLHVQIGAQREATYVTSTTVDPQWDTQRVIHIDRSNPDEVVYYVRSEVEGEITELVERGASRWDRVDEDEWEETTITPSQPAEVHTAAAQQAEQYSSVELISPPDQLFRLIPYDLGTVPALMHVDDQLRPVRVESEGLEGQTVYAYDEPMEIPEVG